MVNFPFRKKREVFFFSLNEKFAHTCRNFSKKIPLLWSGWATRPHPGRDGPPSHWQPQVVAGVIHPQGNVSCPMTGGSNRPPRVAVADFVCGCNTPNRATLVVPMRVVLTTPPASELTQLKTKSEAQCQRGHPRAVIVACFRTQSDLQVFQPNDRPMERWHCHPGMQRADVARRNATELATRSQFFLKMNFAKQKNFQL